MAQGAYRFAASPHQPIAAARCTLLRSFSILLRSCSCLFIQCFLHDLARSVQDLGQDLSDLAETLKKHVNVIPSSFSPAGVLAMQADAKSPTTTTASEKLSPPLPGLSAQLQLHFNGSRICS